MHPGRRRQFRTCFLIGEPKKTLLPPYSDEVLAFVSSACLSESWLSAGLFVICFGSTGKEASDYTIEIWQVLLNDLNVKDFSYLSVANLDPITCMLLFWAADIIHVAAVL